MYFTFILNAKSRQPRIGLQVDGQTVDPNCMVLLLKAPVLGRRASGSWLWRSLIALFLPLAGVLGVPTLVIELCARFRIEGESLRVLRLVWVSVLAWPWFLLSGLLQA